MRKAEVQPPASFKLSINFIIPLLLQGQRIPNPRFLLIPPNIINLGKQKQANTQQVNDDQVAVPAVVQWLVVGAIDEVSADVA
jgi:hypothetical protein